MNRSTQNDRTVVYQPYDTCRKYGTLRNAHRIITVTGGCCHKPVRRYAHKGDRVLMCRRCGLTVE